MMALISLTIAVATLIDIMLLGHASVATTESYTQPSERDLAEAVNGLA